MSGWSARLATLRAELAALGVERDPRCLALAVAIATLEARGAADGYLASDAGPASDTLMAWEAAPPPPGLAAACADAVARAVAARDALRALDGALPGQPLAVHVARTPDAHVVGNPLTHAAFVIGRQIAVAPLDGDRATLVAALVALAADRWVAPLAPPGAAPPALVAWVSDGAWPDARHSHRAAWTAAGGPWLGIARAGSRVVLSTTHFVVDGYGHAWLAATVAATLATAAPIAPADGRGVPPAEVALPVVPLALAVRTLDGAGVGAGRLAYALGAALLARDPRARWSPSIQVPVAAGVGDTSAPHRVTPALVRVARAGDRLESYDVFASRYRAAVARERAQAGLVSRVLAAAHALPMPRAWKRGVAGAPVRPRWLAPITELLAGRAGASVLRLPAAWAAPGLIAASSPAVGASAADPRGAWLATVVQGGAQAVLTVGGTGTLGDGGALGEVADRLAAVWSAGPR